MNDPLHVQLCRDEVIANGELRVSFRRTSRVPDNQQVLYLPPDLGAFPLRAGSEYAGKICPDMSAKGGLFFPMWQSEAMWLNFSCTSERKYMIKVYVGGVNVISSEPAIEAGATKLRRQAKLAAARRNGSEAWHVQLLSRAHTTSAPSWSDTDLRHWYTERKETN
ncbi:hypothetical protein N0V91_007264 [Didymella pomorum]|uniref:Uncharacterized protein n=1 Tax=Didymella pomorum TaxID=749634 RepID=A0A9W8ZD94_9PLEO|nr:hypothetical protein N0V91_007264 [Didymella pomorum]